MTIRVFLDANVPFSASNEPSNIARVIRLLIEHGEPVTSDFAVEEARRNIMIKRPGWAETFGRLMDELQIIPSIQFDLPVALADKDKPILCTAIRSGARYLATGDKTDFGHLYDHTVEKVTVITLLKLAELLLHDRRPGRCG